MFLTIVNKDVTTENSNRKSYCRRIKKLCYKTLKGDSEAEILLKKELSNPDAQRVIKEMTRRAKKIKIKAKKIGIPASNIKSWGKNSTAMLINHTKVVAPVLEKTHKKAHPNNGAVSKAL
ncbi:MAG: hypothetical protein A6F71_01930 [Cycloclasticus sp. symbiont of Poecilosclerida sp. M]|nr:MAG: hypothetical protein A6F71_01930 [Cycloclasticus sp. symbiont of Poecilosclerida sp. M]